MSHRLPVAKVFLAYVGCAVAAWAQPAASHHSPRIFDTGSVIAFEGNVSRVHWANPHTYVYVETRDETGKTVEWQLETDAIPLLLRSGWEKDTLRPGDHIAVRANPDRNPSRNHALIESLRMEDGTILTSVPAGTEPVSSASSLAGQGQQVVPWSEHFGKLAEVALTDKGSTARASYDMLTEDPVLNCVGYPPPAAQILLYYVNEITIGDDRVVIRNEFFDSERIVHLDGRSHPVDAPRTNEGHSVGWWEDDVLVVDTTHFADYRSTFPGTGLPSGEHKHLVERYALSEDGSRIVIDFVLEDPEYLAAPFSSTIEWLHAPQLEMASFGCELNEARRFLGP
ncbi:MAG TPA: DUF6152 family protein [Gammaproteobacteria bacterium]